MQTSDHFPAYIALAGSVLALLGTFGALLLTRRFERKREEARKTREERTRLHDMRVEAYVDYLSATSVMFGSADVWFQRAITDGTPKTIEDTLDRTFPKYLNAYSRVSLVASGPVLERVAEVHAAISRLVGPLGMETAASVLDALTGARRQFSNEARAELGIAEMETRVPTRLRAKRPVPPEPAL